MTKKYERPIPDYSTALPPKVPALDVSEGQVLAILKKRPGRLFTASEILVVLKENIHIWDNAAAVIWAASKLEEHGKAQTGGVEVDGKTVTGWMVPKPPDPVDAVPKQ